MKKILVAMFLFLACLLESNAQAISGAINGSTISDAQINQAIKDVLGNDFSVLLKNSGVDINAIIMEQIERQLVKAAATSSLSSPTAVAIMDAYELRQKNLLASELSTLRDELGNQSQRVLAMQENLIRLKMQNKLSGSLPSLVTMNSIRVSDLQSATSSDMAINDLLNKSGVGTSLSVYERLQLSDRIKRSIQNKNAQQALRQLLQNADNKTQAKLRGRLVKSKMVLSSTQIVK
jgi:beta-glucosidase-like glycosyl hydrolase